MNEQSRTVARVLATLDQLSVAPRPLSNLELARALDIPASSMHRLLNRLHALGHLERDAATACYSVAPRLSRLGSRLADAGGFSLPLQELMSSIRDQTGHTVSVWVPAGAQVRLAALLVGRLLGPIPNEPGELREPFCAPGLAIATQYSRAEVSSLIAQARRRRIPLGRRLRKLHDVTSAIDQVIRRGYAVGYNLKLDGWAVLAWPLRISATPPRPGALAIGGSVPALRGREPNLVALVEQVLAIYRNRLEGRRKSPR